MYSKTYSINFPFCFVLALNKYFMLCHKPGSMCKILVISLVQAASKGFCKSFHCLHTQSMHIEEDSSYNLDLKPGWIHQHVCSLKKAFFIYPIITKIICAG